MTKSKTLQFLHNPLVVIDLASVTKVTIMDLVLPEIIFHKHM